MKRSKKPNLSPKGIAKNKKELIILIIIIALCIGVFAFSKKENKATELTTTYYTGSLYSANMAANLLDYTYNKTSNVVISPFNINTNLAILYNGTDNTSSKELQKYFHSDLKKVNKDMEIKMSSINEEKKEKNKFAKLYESYIAELDKKSYSKLTTTEIKKLSKTEKENLQLLLKKISLTQARLNGENNLSEKTIKKYVLNDKEKTYNEYSIKSLLEETLDYYETYSIDNMVINYNELYNNHKLNKKNLNEEFLSNIKIYNTSITSIDFYNQDSVTTINNKIKEVTSDKVNRIIEEFDLQEDYIMTNSLYFNYEWDNNFINNAIRTEEFYNYNEQVNVVSMMYSKENIYLENENATGFIKPFENNKYSFVGILPKSFEDIELSTLDLDNLLLSRRETPVLIGLPKFEYQYYTDLKKLHSNYNITNLYSSKANFTRLTENKMHISKNIQEINISIGEKGTTESSVSKKVISTIIDENINKKVVLNRPFAYMIINNETGDVMLIGKVINFYEGS